MKLAILAMLLLSGLGLASCSASKTGALLADLPSDYGGIPKNAPPRPGTIEYDEWQRQRAVDAATPKTDSKKK